MKCFRFFALVVACSVSTSALAQTVLKIATLSPAGSIWMREMSSGAKAVAEATNDRVIFKFYTGGSMGDDFSVMRKIRSRQLHGGVFQTQALQNLASDIQIYNLPMQFRSLDEVDQVRKLMDPLLVRKIEEAGFVCFGISELGLAFGMSRKAATGIDEVRKHKVWYPKGDAAGMRTLDAFDIKGVPQSIVDVLVGLQSGLLETVVSPPIAAVALQWHTAVKYLLDIPFVYVYSFFLVDDRQFARISEEDRAVVREVMGGVMNRLEERNRADHEAAYRALVEQGLKVLTPTAEERAAWQASADLAGPNWVKHGLLSQDLYDQFMNALSEIRSGQDGADKL